MVLVKFILTCFKSEKLSIDNLVEITLYKKSFSQVLKLSGSKINPHSNDDKLYELVKEHVYGKECNYFILECGSSKCPEGFNAIAALLTGKSFNITLYPIPARVFRIDLLRSEEKEEVKGENILITNELKKIKSLEINDELYVLNTDVKMLSKNVIFDAIRICTEYGDRVIILERAREEIRQERRKRKRRRKKRRRLKKKS